MKQLTLLKLAALALAAICVNANETEVTNIEIGDICNFDRAHGIKCHCHDEKTIISSAGCFIEKLGNVTIEKDSTAWEVFRRFGDVEYLDLIGNTKPYNVTYIPSSIFDYMPKLLQINANHAYVGQIEAYNFANHTALKDINVRFNRVKKLEENSFAHLPNVRSIRLIGNLIERISKNVFVDLPVLKHIDLISNRITTIEDGAFENLENLERLDLDFNRLTTVNAKMFKGLKSLKKLNLQLNKLEVIEDNSFVGLTNLETLIIDLNKIKHIAENAFNGLLNLSGLILASNKLNKIESAKIFDGLKSLTTLDLEQNQLTELTYDVMRPILSNFNGNSSKLVIDGNNFPCDCRLDWLATLRKETQSKEVITTIRNLKCIPDDALKSESENTSSPRLYVDVRYFLKCEDKQLV